MLFPVQASAVIEENLNCCKLANALIEWVLSVGSATGSILIGDRNRSAKDKQTGWNRVCAVFPFCDESNMRNANHLQNKSATSFQGRNVILSEPDAVE
jgi:hypothetical protein